MNTNIRRRLTISLVAALIIVPVTIAGVHLIKQNYKRHHYITGTIQYGRYRGQKYRFTEEQQDEMNEEAYRKTIQIIDAENKLHAAHPR